MSEISDLITALQKSELIGQCPECRQSSNLQEFLLFDGTIEFPDLAKVIVEGYEKGLTEAREMLSKKTISSDEGAEKKSLEVNYGKTIEKLIHLHKDFNFPLEDCRFLGDPLDVLVFNGSAQNSVNHITFMEIKTGEAKLNPHQKMIRDAVNDQNVIVEQLE